MLAPLDRLRRHALLHSGPLGRLLLADRALRVTSIALIGLAVSLGLTGVAPLWLLVFGPLVLGVPHLLADVRYLVVRPGLHRRRAWWLACALPLAATSLTAAPWAGALAVIGGAAVARDPRWIGLGLGVVLLAAAVVAPTATTWALLHAHNLIAIGLWWAWRPAEPRRSVPVLAVLGAYGAILLGALDPLLLGHARIFWTPDGMTAGRLFGELAPGVPHPWDARVVASFAFAQSVHYAVWLRWIPEDDRRRHTPRPLLASYRALVDDFGAPVLVGVAVLAVGIGAWACVSVPAARGGYLRLATFHGWMELACLAGWLGARRAP